MRNKPATLATLEDCRRLLERLCRGIEAAERSLSQLAQRIEPWDAERATKGLSWVDAIASISGPATLQTMIEIARHADRHLIGLEMHGNAIRARIVEIADDVMSREELKRHLRQSEKA
jgi:hypothetical protein